MKERPILFSAPMIRALLDGTKTQTRRVVKMGERATDALANAESPVAEAPGYFRWPTRNEPGRTVDAWNVWSPFGVPGDRLWVRETWALLTGNGHRIVYRADADPPMTCGDTEPVRHMKWTPSIYMRRQHSRITLEITDVRVERLQAISEEDARAEGACALQMDRDPDTGRMTNLASFEGLWDSINAKRAPWSSNPWVWALTFRRVTP